MKNYITAISILISVIILTGLAYLQSEKWLKQNATQGCLQVGINTFNSPKGNSSAQIPDMNTYNNCMQEKGY